MNDFILLNQIGEGSFGRVFKARRKFTGQIVAIKMINKYGQTKDDLQSFRREIEILRSVDHQNVMKFIDIFETDTDFCVVTELGRADLFQIIDDNQTLSEDVIKTIAAQLVSALQHLHHKRIIHRDMKPQNVLISFGGSIKLCDFGFARALSMTTLVLNSIKGTPLYMAPELVQEKEYNESIDIWSLGIILYELYFGKPPFFTDSIYKLIQMISNEPITWPGKISPEFKSFLSEMLQKDPMMRSSCDRLMQHPFICDVDISQFNNDNFIYKSKQFEACLVEDGVKFSVPDSSTPDLQAILMNPSSYPDDDLLYAIGMIRDNGLDPEYPSIMSFVTHFEVFISRESVVTEALRLSTDILRIDTLRFRPYFTSAVRILSNATISIENIAFFVELLVMPYANSIIQAMDPPDLDISFEPGLAEKLRDKLVSFLFSSESLVYVLISYLCQVSNEFLATFCSSNSPQYVPIITAAVINNISPCVTAAAISILTMIVSETPSAFQSIIPLQPFANTIEKVLTEQNISISSFCVFSSALAFCSISFQNISQGPEFRFLVTDTTSLRLSLSKNMSLFTAERFFNVASSMPQTDDEYLCYMSIQMSPFYFLPVNSERIGESLEKIPVLLNVHHQALLETIFSFPRAILISHLDNIFSLFVTTTIVEYISNYLLSLIEWKPQLYKEFCQHGALAILSNVLSDNSYMHPNQVCILLLNIILLFKQESSYIEENLEIILGSLFSIDAVSEISLMIASHLVRLSPKYLESIIAMNGLGLAQRGLHSTFPIIKARSAQFIGVIAMKGGRIDPDFYRQILPLLKDLLKEDHSMCKMYAAFSLGNIVHEIPDLAPNLIDCVPSLSILLSDSHTKSAEYAACCLANMSNKTDKYIDLLIQHNIPTQVLVAMGNGIYQTSNTVFALAVFCQNDIVRNSLRKLDFSKYLIPYTKSLSTEVRTAAKELLRVLREAR